MLALFGWTLEHDQWKRGVSVSQVHYHWWRDVSVLELGGEAQGGSDDITAAEMCCRRSGSSRLRLHQTSFTFIFRILVEGGHHGESRRGGSYRPGERRWWRFYNPENVTNELKWWGLFSEERNTRKLSEWSKNED